MAQRKYVQDHDRPGDAIGIGIGVGDAGRRRGHIGAARQVVRFDRAHQVAFAGVDTSFGPLAEMEVLGVVGIRSAVQAGSESGRGKRRRIVGDIEIGPNSSSSLDKVVAEP
jgi:hypothetical protein